MRIRTSLVLGCALVVFTVLALRLNSVGSLVQRAELGDTSVTAAAPVVLTEAGDGRSAAADHVADRELSAGREVVPAMTDIQQEGRGGTVAGQGAETVQGLQPSVAISKPRRLIVLADLHGDLEQAHNALRMLGVVDDQARWAAGNAVLVQTGDIVDRGDRSLDLIDYFEDLQAQAAAAGGEVVMLLGNHEVFLIQGQFGYVNHKELKRLGGGSADKGRVKFREAVGPDAKRGQLIRSRRAAYVSDVPGCRLLMIHAGLVPWMLDVILKRLDDLGHQSAGGTAGRTVDGQTNITSASGAAPSDGWPQQHAQASSAGGVDQLGGPRDRRDGAADSLNKTLAHRFADELSALVTPHLARCTNAGCPEGKGQAGYQAAEALLGGDGAVWTRRYVLTRRELVCAEVENMTRQLQVDRIVVGHSIQNSGKVGVLCGGRVLMIDLGMSREILGHMGGLECTSGTEGGTEGGTLVIRYADRSADVVLPPVRT